MAEREGLAPSSPLPTPSSATQVAIERSISITSTGTFVPARRPQRAVSWLGWSNATLFGRSPARTGVRRDGPASGSPVTDVRGDLAPTASSDPLRSAYLRLRRCQE